MVSENDMESIDKMAARGLNKNSNSEYQLLPHFETSDKPEFLLEKSPKNKFTTRQLYLLVFLMFSNFLSSLVISLQAPFFPAEAESKGATAMEYGLVFACYEIVAFIVAPIYGKYMPIIGVRFMMISSLFVVSIACILFGFLRRIQSRSEFIGISLGNRVVESLGGTAFDVSSICLIAQEFPGNIATTFAFLELCFELGMICGPTIGGALFELGGFELPFFCIGTMVFVTAIISCIAMESMYVNQPKSIVGSLAVLKVFPVSLSMFTVSCSSCSIAFLVATLEPHFRQFHLSPVEVGYSIVISGLVYAITAGCWGKLSDKSGHHVIYWTIGTILICVSYLFLGPAPFIPLEANIWMCYCALAIHGLGQGAQLVCGFSGGLRAATENGYPDDASTNSLISSLYTSAVALGACIGPALGGILMDLVGFRNTTMALFSLHAFVAIVSISYLFARKRKEAKGTKAVENGTIDETLSLLQ